MNDIVLITYLDKVRKFTDYKTDDRDELLAIQSTWELSTKFNEHGS